jgi:histo-blood group ABO system transferase
MKVGFIIVATGGAYIQYAQELIGSMERHAKFPHRRFIFTDKPETFGFTDTFPTEAKGYPNSTLFRYHMIAGQADILSNYDQLFYVDADMLFVSDFELIEISSPGLTAALHPGYWARNTNGTPETRRESTAFCNFNSHYYCGGFQGGDAQSYLRAAERMAFNIDTDDANGITAVWHDESHWNKYLAQTSPSRVLTPSFCYPEDYDGGYGWDASQCRPILVALDKRKRGNHPRYES